MPVFTPYGRYKNNDIILCFSVVLRNKALCFLLVGLKSKSFVVVFLSETKEISNTIICRHLGFNFMKDKKS